MLAMPFIGLARIMGLERSSRFFGHLFSATGPLFPVNKIAMKNLRAAFPEIGEARITSLNREMWRNLGMFFSEFVNFDTIREELDQRLKITGLDNVANAAIDGRGLIYFSAHMGNWEIMHLAIPMHDRRLMGVYRKTNNPFFDKWIKKARKKTTAYKLAPKGSEGAKDIINTLKNGGAVCVLNDQKMNDGDELTFFKRPAMTPTAMAKIARKYDVPLIFVSNRRLENAHFEVVFHPAFHAPRTQDRHQDVLDTAQKMNDMMEAAIRLEPAQWLWMHNRWK